MTAVKLSEKMGKSRALLSVYRKIRNLPKKTDPMVINNMYLFERERQDRVKSKIQDMYYELKESKNIRNFGLVLEAKGSMTHKGFSVMLGRSFMQRERLIGLRAIEHYEEIIKMYEEWK